MLETKEKLEILAKHKVVDAGAKGFVVFLEGIVDFFKDGKLKELLHSHAVQPAFADKIDSLTHENFNFRYCTEALLSGTDLDRCNIRQKLERYGDSVVVAGSPKKVRVHIHTDHPAKLFTDLYQCGHIISQKVDDMFMQQKVVHERKSDIALVTDSTSDLPQEIIEKYQIHVVPLSVHFGETHFLDQVTLKSSQFYKMFENSKVYPSSAQPTIKEFTNKFNYLSTHYKEILSIHLSRAMSGTTDNSEKSAKSITEQTGVKIDVYDSKRVTGALGLIVLRTAKSIEAGTPLPEIKKNLPVWISKCDVLVSVKTLKYMVKGGRVSKMKGFMGNALNMKPIVSMNEQGRTELLTRSFSEKGSMKKIYGLLEKRLYQQEVWGYSITHVKNRKTADWYAEKLKALTGKDPEFIHDASPVLGVNTGPGTVAVSFMME
ncbi:MAG: DegV family protein [Bacteroidota bacterium]|nr:DegV family protein [Bacteroidota bacterium]